MFSAHCQHVNVMDDVAQTVHCCEDCASKMLKVASSASDNRQIIPCRSWIMDGGFCVINREWVCGVIPCNIERAPQA